jgi:hypothetical protein
VDLYIQGVVLNWLSTGTILPVPFLNSHIIHPGKNHVIFTIVLLLLDKSNLASTDMTDDKYIYMYEF